MALIFTIIFNIISASCSNFLNLRQVENAGPFNFSSQASFPVGSSVFFRCNPGFQHEGSNRIVCQSDGTWTQTTGRCRIPRYSNFQCFSSLDSSIASLSFVS